MKCPSCGRAIQTKKAVRPDNDESDSCPECGEKLDKGVGRNDKRFLMK